MGGVQEAHWVEPRRKGGFCLEKQRGGLASASFS